ncbi:starch-binding domain-containing protein 1 [Microcebus murinus]|uniref:Starch-binding domain-containing protein 1 n=1 Tax=Microcebus murinus TaxID=30608 RepID=A0A8C5W7M5_MICMU|nr:starch-binding domain-containing protein 1 [Microcebus murinus]
MGAVWSALLVGGGLAGALVVWLLRGAPGDAGQGQDAPPGEAAAPGGDRDGGGALGPGPSGQEPATKAEHLQESNGRLISETKDLGHPQEEARELKNPGEVSGKSGEHVPSGQFPDTKCPATSENGNSRSYSESSRNESLQSPAEEWGFRKGRETSADATQCFADKLPSSNLRKDRDRDVSLAPLDSQDLANHGDWELVSRHSSWGDVGVGGSLEASVFGPNQGADYGRGGVVEAGGREACGETERAAARSSETQQVSVRFQVHYVTSTDGQFIAVTGDHEGLGRWNTYTPLHHTDGGFWAHSVSLPADTVVEWKFVLVENGQVARWEECSNRSLETGHEDRVVHKWWGVH